MSAPTQVGGGGLLFRFTCSVVLWGGRGTADKCHWPVWGALAVSGHTWFAPARSMCATLLRLQAALQGVGPELRALPRPKPRRFRFSSSPRRRRLGWASLLCLPQSKQLRQPGAWGAHSPQVPPDFSPPHPWAPLSGAPCVSSGELIAGCLADLNHPESQQVFG